MATRLIVHVDQQVALGGAAVDLDVLALVGHADVREVLVILGVVVRQVVREERTEHPFAHRPLDLRGRASGGAASWPRSA